MAYKIQRASAFYTYAITPKCTCLNQYSPRLPWATGDYTLLECQCIIKSGGVILQCNTRGTLVLTGRHRTDIYIQKDKTAVLLVGVGLAQARPNNKRNAHIDGQELLLQFWTERHETWQEYGEA